jgi:hypothetical protein
MPLRTLVLQTSAALLVFPFALRRDVGYVILESRIVVLSEILWAFARLSHRTPSHRNDPGHRGAITHTSG